MKRLSKRYTFQQTVYRHESKVGSYEVPAEPRFQDEIALSVFRRLMFDANGDKQIEDPDRFQGELVGSRRAIRELGKYLINLSNIGVAESGYHSHLEFPFAAGSKGLELIVRVPTDTQQIHLPGSGYVT